VCSCTLCYALPDKKFQPLRKKTQQVLCVAVKCLRLQTEARVNRSPLLSSPLLSVPHFSAQPSPLLAIHLHSYIRYITCLSVWFPGQSKKLKLNSLPPPSGQASNVMVTVSLCTSVSDQCAETVPKRPTDSQRDLALLDQTSYSSTGGRYCHKASYRLFAKRVS